MIGGSYKVSTRFCFVARSAVFLLSIGLAHAALITQSSDIPSPSTAIDFSDFAGVNSVFTDGPIQVGNLVGVDVTFTSDNPDGAYIGSGPYGLADNGAWDSTLTMAGILTDLAGTDPYTMIFTFNSGPVSAVGGFMNYATFDGSGFGDVYIRALAFDNSILEEWDITTGAPISTPGATNDGAFRGILRPTADIFGFSVSNSAAVLTNLTFSSEETSPSNPAVPEPGSIILLLSGFVLLACKRLWMARN
jgi:hypothetical protein